MSSSSNMQLKDYEAIIKRVVGAKAKINRAEAGLVNAVFLVDERYVFRFPRDDEVYAQQVFERDVCLYLAKHAQELPFGILKPVDKQFDHCFVYEYIPGSTLSEQELRGLDLERQKKFVRDLSKFIYWLGGTLGPDKYQEIVAASGGKPIEHWEEYLQRTVMSFVDFRYLALVEVCRELTVGLESHYPEGIEAQADRVIHDDLHMGNLLFIDGNLSGVIDFGNIMIGDLACEFRHFYRLSPEIAQMAIEEYEATYGKRVDIDKVAWWAKVNDAATMCDKILAGKIGSPSYVRAKENLAKWYPGKSWNF